MKRRVFLLIAVAIAGCNTPSQSSSSFEVVDEAGVRTALNGETDDTASLALDAVLEIGVAEGDSLYELDDVGPIEVGSDGTIFAADGGSKSIRVFDAEGRFQQRIGRRGQGPGEFRSIDRLWVRGDTIIVFDRAGRRATLFARDGHLLGTWDLRRSDGARFDITAITSDGVLGWLRPVSRRYSMEPWALFQDTAYLRVVEPISGELGPVLLQQPSERRISGAEVYPADPLFEPRTVNAFRSDGVLYEARAGQYEINVYAVTGAQTLRIRRVVPAVPITAEQVTAVKEKAYRGEQAAAVERAARYPTAPSFAIIGSILVADDGTLLLQRLDDIDPVQLERNAQYGAFERWEAAIRFHETRWELIDNKGRYLGAVRVPRRYWPRHFNGDVVTGVSEDELGVNRIVQLRLIDPR